MAEPEYGFRSYIESIGRLERYVLGGGRSINMSAYEAGLFQEVEEHMKD